MNELDIWLLAVGLAMDCFTVSIASGILLKQVHGRTILGTASCFGLFQALMPAIGWYATLYFSTLFEAWDHWIAFGLLAFLGGNMIYGHFKEEETRRFNPRSPKTILALAVATSIDALAVGISFTCMGMKCVADILYPTGIIGLVSFVLSVAGFLIGIFVGKRFRCPVEPIGGIILVGIGCKVLYTHLAGV